MTIERTLIFPIDGISLSFLEKSVLKGLKDVSNHDDGILIYLRSILLSLSHRFDSFAPANMLHNPSPVFYVCCMHADSVRKTKCSRKQMFLSCCMLSCFSFLSFFLSIFSPFYLSQIQQEHKRLTINAQRCVIFYYYVLQILLLVSLFILFSTFQFISI